MESGTTTMGNLINISGEHGVSLTEDVDYLKAYRSGRVDVVSRHSYTPTLITIRGEGGTLEPRRYEVSSEPHGCIVMPERRVDTSRAYVEAAVRQGIPVVEGMK